MKRLTIAFLLMLVLLRSGLKAENWNEELEREVGLERQAKQLRREISLHNLLNGLNLTVSQMERILKQTCRAYLLRKEVYGSGNKRGKQVLGAYSRILKSVSKGERIPKDLEALGGLMELTEKREKKRYLKEMRALERKVLEIMSPAQRKVFRGFDPCLIPPQNLGEPVQVGQASSHNEAKRVLELVRQLPKYGFDRECRQLLSQHMAQLEKFLGPMEPRRRESELARMAAICRKARNLDDVDFALQSDELAEELELDKQKSIFKNKAEEFMKLIEKVQGGRIGKVANHFLDPLVINILEKRIERAKSNPKQIESTCITCAPSTSPKKKWALGELAKELKLNSETTESLRSSIGQAKVKHMQILQSPLADGTTPLARFLELASLPTGQKEAAAQQLMMAMQEPLPGEVKSPMEKILRLKISLTRELKAVLTSTEFNNLSALVDDLLEHIELEDKGKPRANSLAKKLGLNYGAATKFTDIIRKGKTEAWKVLSTPMNDGKKPISFILQAQSAGPAERQAKMERFVRSLGQPLPGRGMTYGEKIEKIKRGMQRKLRQELTGNQYGQFEAMGLDILDIEVDD